MIEANTDAVGKRRGQLSLSDRRAETVCQHSESSSSGIPPEKNGETGLWREVSEDPDAGSQPLQRRVDGAADRLVLAGNDRN